MKKRMREGGQRAREKVRQGVFLLPSLLTVISISLTFWALTAIINLSPGPAEVMAHTFFVCSWLLVGAFICDGLDGRVARLTGTSSEFGIQLDSLADVLSFGITPSLLAYSWALRPFGRVGGVVCFLFVVCGTVRLARFNVQTGEKPDKRYFTGLPIPMAALGIGLVMMNLPAPPERGAFSFAMLILVCVLSFLMVSRVRYRSFKDIDLRRPRGFRFVALMAAALAFSALFPELTLLLAMWAYVMSGPLAKVVPERWKRLTSKASRSIEEIVEGGDDDLAPGIEAEMEQEDPMAEEEDLDSGGGEEPAPRQDLDSGSTLDEAEEEATDSPAVTHGAHEDSQELLSPIPLPKRRRSDIAGSGG